MTVWPARYAISWDKFEAATLCQLMLKFKIEKQPLPFATSNYYMHKGWLVQWITEMYVNQGVHLREGGLTNEKFQLAINKLCQSQKFLEKLNETRMIAGKTASDFIAEVQEQAMRALILMREVDLLGRPALRSEVTWISSFRGLQLFAKMDFTDETDPHAVGIFDGKGHARKNAEEGQIRLYSMCVS